MSILSSNSLTSFYLKHFCIEIEASLTGNEHLFGGYKRGLCSSSFPPPPHSLVTYCSLNKSAVFILCPAAKQLNGRAIDRAGSPLPPVCLCGELVLIWAHISVPGLYTRASARKLIPSSVSTVWLASSNYGTKIHSLCLWVCATALTHCEGKKQIRQAKCAKKTNEHANWTCAVFYSVIQYYNLGA